jgi:hypothetical protein
MTATSANEIDLREERDRGAACLEGNGTIRSRSRENIPRQMR